MPGKWPLPLLFTALLGGCGPKAKDCPPDDQNACTDTSLAYDAGIADIFNARCVACHGPGGVEAKAPLTSYKQVFGERMTIGSQLVTCTMPPDGSPQLTNSERTQILGWLSCGAPQ